MPKLKTRKAVKKRMRITGTGKIKRFRAGRGHLLTGKSAKSRRHLRSPALVSSKDRRAIAALLPYGA